MGLEGEVLSGSPWGGGEAIEELIEAMRETGIRPSWL
jgi:hypothetical protein